MICQNRHWAIWWIVVWREFSESEYKKPTEIVVDFRVKKDTVNPVIINGEEVDRVEN